MKYMLDTNICIYIIKQRPESVLNKFKTLSPGDICISSITVAELSYGVEKSLHPQKNKTALSEFMLPLDVMPFDYDAADRYGHIRNYLEKKGTPIGALDLMIAAHALSLKLTIVTHNLREFSRVPKLHVIDWV